MKTTFELIEAIRVELKNNITKIKKEISEGKIIPYAKEDDEKSDAQNDSQILDEEIDDKSALSEHSEKHEPVISSQSEKSYSSSKSDKRSQKSGNWIKSKKISKDDTREYFKEVQ